MPRSKTGPKATASRPSPIKTRATKAAADSEPRDSEAMRLAKWARRNGATRIRLGELEIDFTAADVEHSATPSLQGPYSAFAQNPAPEPIPGDLPPNLEYLREKAVAADSALEASPAINGGQDDPDAYARNSDAWANQVRLPRR